MYLMMHMAAMQVAAKIRGRVSLHAACLEPESRECVADTPRGCWIGHDSPGVNW